jgi:abortive infection bacteriophage resistance protein
MRYTKQAMTLAQQIQTLQGRGLMIAETNKAEQALLFKAIQTCRLFGKRCYG